MAVINLSEFRRPVAVVDWVLIRFELSNKSHGGHLKNEYAALGVSYCNALDKGPGGAASIFEIRVQAPSSFKSIWKLTNALESRYGFSCPPQLLAIEVSIDFYHPHADSSKLQDMTRHLMMRLAPPTVQNPRQIGEKHEQPNSLPSKLAIDITKTLYIGNKQDDILWRVYWKRTDDTFVGEDNVRTPNPLPPEQHRARAEVMIQGKALADLGLLFPTDLVTFKFERLHSQKLFKFAHPKPSIGAMFSDPYAAASAKALCVSTDSPACVLNQFGRRKKGRHALRVLSKYLVTDITLTDRVRDALRQLTRNF